MSTTSTTAADPRDVITEDNVNKALKADKGSEAFLKSWKVVDFTKRGDNYACLVTSVEVKYSTNDEEDCAITYVVKLNPHRKFSELQEAEPYIFAKEGKFYEEVVPWLNKAITSTGQETLRFPKCFFVSLEEGKEQIIFEDLRTKGFKLFDRRKGMDKDHVALVIAELARLHSASYLLTKKFLKVESAAEKFECLSKDFLTFTPSIKELFVSWFQSNVETGILMLEKVGGYETAVSWLKSFKDEVENVLGPVIQSTKFNSICHGDCWNNNLLFRYNDEGHPIEVMLLDLQLCREASVTSDVNYLLYTSVDGDVRISNLDNFMSLYHSTYKEVVEAGHMSMHFTKEDIMEEFRDKNKFGLLFALVSVPFLLTDPEEIPNFAETDLETLKRDFRTISMGNLKTNPLCKPRFLAVFDELMQTGLIS